MHNIELKPQLEINHEIVKCKSDYEIHHHVNDNKRCKFTFQPTNTIDQQIVELRALIKNKQWNGQISIKYFYGTFKQEYWDNLEESLREFSGITKFTFLNTKLDKKHLILLKSLIQWINPKEISIKFKHNEIDDLDLDDFLIKWLLPSFGARIKTFKVVSNPGIFKGNFVSQLKHELIRKSDLDPEFTYHLVRNKEYKSIGFIRILKPQPYQIFTIDLIKQLEISLKQTCYLQFTLEDLFGEKNSKAFDYLIDLAYHKDKLEFIESLNIKYCFLGSEISMVKMAKKISTSKGLLSLGLSNTKLIHNSQVLKSLNGDRYDRLRLNHIDIGGNKDMSRLALKLMADNLISKSLKSVDFGNTLVECESIEFRIKHITEAFFKQIQFFRKLMVENKKIPKFNLKQLDLALFDSNFKSNEIILTTSTKALVQSIVLNEFSAVKKLKLGQVDLQTISALLSALDTFEQHIDEMKKTNHLYTTFVPRLNSIQMSPQEDYKIDVDQYKKLMERFFFTKSTDLLQIRSLQFSCLQENLLALMKLLQTLDTEPKQVSKVQYTLENLTMGSNKTEEEYGVLLFQNVIFSKKFQIKILIIKDQIIKKKEWKQILTLGQKFLEQIPLQLFWTLRKLEFSDLGGGLDIYKLVELMVFSEKMRLEELILLNLEVKKNDKSFKSLKEKALTCVKSLTIQILHLGGFEVKNELDMGKIRNDTISEDLLEVLVIHPMSQINELLIFDLYNNCFEKLLKQLTYYQNLGHKPLKDLKSLVINSISFESEKNWGDFADIFIFGRDINISSFELHGILINMNMSKGLNNSHQRKLSYQTKINEHDFFCNSLDRLIFDYCTFDDEILSLLFTAQKESIKVLHIIKCFRFDNCILKFQEVFESNIEKFSYVEFSLQEFNMNDSQIHVKELFEWFMRNIIFNKKHQRLECLSISTIKKFHLDLLIDIFQELKEFQQDNKLKNYFKIRKFIYHTFRERTTPDHLSSQSWISFFDNINPGMKSFVKNEQIIQYSNQDKILRDRREISNQKLKTREQKCQEIHELLKFKRLSIPQRLLTTKNAFGSYSITSPVQLYKLELNVCFSQENEDIQQGLYNLIFKGLVYYPGSQLRELTLNYLDFDMFMNSSEVSSRSFLDINSIPLKYLKLSICDSYDNGVGRRFAKLYVQDLTINLETIILDYYHNGFLPQIHQNISESINDGQRQGKIFSLQRLEIYGANQLDEQETLQFFQIVVLNCNLPIQILRLDRNDLVLKSQDNLVLKSQDNLMQLLKDHLIQQNYKCPLKELSLSGENYSTYKTIKLILPLFIQGDQIRLDKFRYKQDKDYLDSYNDSDYNSNSDSNSDVIESFGCVFGGICNLSQLTNFTISHLKISLIHMCFQEFKFFFYVRPKLKILKLDLPNLTDSDDIKDFLELEKGLDYSIQSWEPCQLQLSTNHKNLLKHFAFEEFLKWSKVKLKFTHVYSKDIIFDDSLAKCIDLKRSLRQLWIDLNRISQRYVFSKIKLSESQIKLIGEQLIYDESSILEELCLISCDLIIPFIKALTLGAETFRNKIEKQKLQMTTNLSLKRFCLHDLKYITDDEADKMNKDLLFFEYINIEKIEVQGTMWNSAMMISQCNYAQAWLDFQSLHSRNCQNFSIKLADWGFNKLVVSQTAWFQLCDTFLFSDKAPLLEVVNFQYMDLQDQQIDWICQKADQFFSRKPKNYVHPLKRLNFSGNDSLSAESWLKVSKKFFFSKQVKLQELNIILTLLDSQEQLDAIHEAGTCAAFKKQNMKLTLHTFLSDDIQLKHQFSQIMSEQPDDYQELKTEPQYLQNKEQNNQEVKDIPPTTLGQTISIMTKNIYKSKEIKDNFSKGSLLRFSEYHIDIVSGLLNPLNQFFEKNLDYHGEVPIDLITCDIFCTMFKYSETNGGTYPYKLLFTPEACEFYNQPTSKIQVINFIQTEAINAELMDQFQIFKLWQLVRSKKSSLDIVYVDYRLDDDLSEFMIKKGYNERDIVNLVRLFPPSQIRLQDTLTLQALKAIYTIMFDNYQFNYSNIIFDKDIFLNVGIGYSFNEFVQRSNITGCIGRFIKLIFYHVLDLFVTSVSKYKFSKEIKQLNDFLSTQKSLYLFLIFFTIIYYVICLFGPYAWQHFYDGDKPEQLDEICKNGITSKGIYSYFVFACNKQNTIIQVFSFLVETFLYRIVSQIIPEHIEGLVSADQEDMIKNVPASVSAQEIQAFSFEPFGKDKLLEKDQILGKDEEQQLHLIKSPQKQDLGLIKSNQKKPQTVKVKHSLKAKFKSFLALSKNGVILGYLINLSLGQFAKLNLYTDVTFILLTYYCKFPYTALFGLISTAFNVYFQLQNLILIILKQCFPRHNEAKLLSTQFINDFYELSTIGRNVALSNILDAVAPYNVTVISNNFVTRSLFPQIAGRSMSNSVRAYVFKFVFGDLPHIILQLYFIIYIAYANGDLSLTLYLTILNTGISVVVSFIKFMIMRPSALFQADFDEITTRQSEQFLDKQIKYLEREYEIIYSLTNYERLEKFKTMQ